MGWILTQPLEKHCRVTRPIAQYAMLVWCSPTSRLSGGSRNHHGSKTMQIDVPKDAPYLLFCATTPLVIGWVIKKKHLAHRPYAINATLGGKCGLWLALAHSIGWLIYLIHEIWFYPPQLITEIISWNVIAFLLGGLPLAIFLGYFTGFLLGLVCEWNPKQSRTRAVLAGLVIALVGNVIVNFLILNRTGLSPFNEIQPQDYWLIVGIPSLIYFLLSGWGGGEIHARLRRLRVKSLM